MLKKAFLFLLITLTSLNFIACSNNEEDLLASKEHVMTTLEGKQLVIKQNETGFFLENDQHKVLIFDIFATWCPPCQASASHLTSLQEKYKDDLVIVGVTIEEPQRTKEGALINDKLNEFKTKYNAQYTIVNSDQNSRLTSTITKILELGSRFPIPLMVMYKDGKYINHYVGAVQEEFVESDIKRALNK